MSSWARASYSGKSCVSKVSTGKIYMMEGGSMGLSRPRRREDTCAIMAIGYAHPLRMRNTLSSAKRAITRVKAAIVVASSLNSAHTSAMVYRGGSV